MKRIVVCTALLAMTIRDALQKARPVPWSAPESERQSEQVSGRQSVAIPRLPLLALPLVRPPAVWPGQPSATTWINRKPICARL